MTCRQLDDKVGIIGLYFCLVRRLVSDDGSALLALMDNDVTPLWVGLRFDRAKYAAAWVGSVAGVYINMQRAQAKGAMIARGVAEGKNLTAAALTCKAVIVF